MEWQYGVITWKFCNFVLEWVGNDQGPIVSENEEILHRVVAERERGVGQEGGRHPTNDKKREG